MATTPTTSPRTSRRSAPTAIASSMPTFSVQPWPPPKAQEETIRLPYTETHEITIGPITLPTGVSVEVATAVGTGGQLNVRISGTTATSKADTAILLQEAF